MSAFLAATSTALTAAAIGITLVLTRHDRTGATLMTGGFYTLTAAFLHAGDITASGVFLAATIVSAGLLGSALAPRSAR